MVIFRHTQYVIYIVNLYLLFLDVALALIKYLTKTSQLQVLLTEHEQLGTLILMKLFCTTLQLRFTTILCKSRRATAKSWQRAHAGAAVSPMRAEAHPEPLALMVSPSWQTVPCSTCASKGESCPERRDRRPMQTNQWLLVCRCSLSMQITQSPFSQKFQCQCVCSVNNYFLTCSSHHS